MLKWLTTRSDTRRAAGRLYGAIVAQSRLPEFYAGAHVPDTVTGRFDMIVLHMFLVLERLQAATGDEAGAAQALAQALNEAFVADMDSAMREMGVADVRVGERMHQAAGAYFGRLMAYRRAISNKLGSNTAGAGPDELADTLLRNVLADTTASPAEARAGADRLAGYARGVSAQLEGLSYEAIAAGMIPFPPSLA